MSRPPIRVLTIGHSYAVALNRQLVSGLAKAGLGRWSISAVAPSSFFADLGEMALETEPGPPGYSLETVDVRMSRFIHAFSYRSQLRNILNQGWDLIHGWEEPFILAGAQLAQWAPSTCPLVLVSAQNIAKHYPPPWGWFERFSMKRAAGVIAWGHSVASTLASRPAYRGKPIRVIPLGVDLEAFRPDSAARAAVHREIGWDSVGPPIAGFLGRFVEEKGLRFLMAALDSLSVPWRGLFVGGGPLEGELRAWASKRPESVRIVTGVTHSFVPRFLNAMDILCAPSLTTLRWREQFGRMIVEAFACGVPVIGSDSGEIPFTLGAAGILVHEGDTAAWALAIGNLLDSPAKRRDFAAAGRARAEEHFGWAVVAESHLKFFEQLLEGKDGALAI